MEQQDMDIMEILNMMEDTIDKASSVPLTGKIMLTRMSFWIIFRK